DAAVAASAVGAVTMPDCTSLGGDLFALVYDARTQKVAAYNASGAAPRSIDRAAFKGAYPERGAGVATVPGIVAGWGEILEQHGRLSLARALHAATEYASDGFPVSGGLAASIAEKRDLLAQDEACARTFLPRGRALVAGEILQQHDLAETLRSVAHGGADSFYRGAVAERLAGGIRRAGGAITPDDLAAHRTDRPAPLEIAYRGLRVFGQPPVSQGHILLEALSLLESQSPRVLGWGSAELMHFMVEATKVAFADRDTHAGDPRVTGFDARRLLDPAYVARRRGAIGERAAEHTTYLCAVDRDGNAVSLIDSVFNLFGSRTIVPGTGVLLNNRLTGFSLDAASPNVLAGGKRPVHTLNAVLALENGIPRFVWGTPGLHAQVQTNFQLAVGLVDFGFEPQRAIDEPRWRHAGGRGLDVEGRVAEGVRRSLGDRGHKVNVLADFAPITGGASVIAIEPNGSFAGGADPRRDCHAAGY
ncbi:MAG: gamma-glutamyltransferase, partial [Chloroflexi bacterium]|nr:gamma-glutamyltransferase [Chloroflexota bacterium]